MNENVQPIIIERPCELPARSVRYTMSRYPSPAAALNAYWQERRPLVMPTIVYAYIPPGGRFGVWAIEEERA